MKPVSQQLVLITGATDGIGKLAALELAKQNAHILIHGRNESKTFRVASELKALSGNERIEFFTADFSSLKNVRLLADDVLRNHPQLDVLINNAGAGYADPRYSSDGYELRLAVNYLAPFLLTRLLLPALKKATPSRIVNVASAGQYRINFDDIMMENKFDPVKAYSQSKLALIMFTMDLAEELKGEKITANSLHPGTYLDTNIVRNAGIKPWGEAQTGADAVVNLAIAPALENITGKYFNVMKEAKADSQAYDREARSRLKAMTVDLIKLG